jgi:type IV pilus assembly protein PilY1
MSSKEHQTMRFPIHRKVAAASAGVALLGVAPLARAQQLDLNPPAPNVLLLLDTSGSMERMIDGQTPEAGGQPCNYDLTGKVITGAVAPTPNRWGNVIQALTGSWTNGVYNCVDMPRTPGSQFTNEYQIAGVKPYDTGYYLDYHRPVMLDPSTSPSTACVVAPGALPGALNGAGVGINGVGSGSNGPGNGQSATDFPADGVILRPLTSPTVAANPATGACSQFPTKQYQTYQYQDGAIPSMTALMRFGLMTFDQDPSPGIGVTSGANPTVVAGAFTGMWSYFPGWNTGGTCNHFGNPPNCTTPSLMAVGARNPAAPPWEGRMIPFPVNDNTLKTQEQYNSWVSSVVLASRPYGATPLAGMLQDAEDYFWTDPNGPQKSDPYVTCGNRPQYIIILTDGAPNLDMRPDCNSLGAPPGQCPFRLPEDIAGEMNAPTGGNSPITTYVIGFAVSSATIDSQLQQCATLMQNGVLDAVCNTPPPANTTLDTAGQACCQLQRIALKGSQNLVTSGVTSTNPNPTPAFFADTPGALQNALKQILSNIAKQATTRTAPTFASSASNFYVNSTTGAGAPQVVGAEYLASFNPSPGQPLTGDLLRKRDLCNQPTGTGTTYTTGFVNPVASQGDDFAANLNSGAGNPRTFIAFQPATQSNGQPVDPAGNIRPYITTDRDGFGNSSVTTYRGDASSVITSIAPTALSVTNTTCQYNAKVTDIPQPPLSAAACAAMTLAYTFGQPSFNGMPGNYPFPSRFGNAFGGIYHASPAVIDAPNTLLQDPGYSIFQSNWQGRQTVAYTATTDGLLHAFWTDESRQENNERWAMLLPAVMPKINKSMQTPTLLLDGSPIVKDVAWDRNLTSAADGTIWHTMLVASYGPNNAGYYAVDVTDPNANPDLASGAIPPDNPLSGSGSTGPTSGPPQGTGPHLRWQLTTVPSGNYSIFASHAATPAITTLFMDPGDGNGAREVAVAILPGGSNGLPSSTPTSCARAPKNGVDSQPIGGVYQYRANVQCWGASTPPKSTDPVPGRAVAIVRVDTGEILQVFERKADATQAGLSDTLVAKNRVIDTPLDSPMTGTPIVYPSDVATDATKAFISDADGTIWKFDLSNPDPTKWTGTLFLDLYNGTVDTNPTSWADGQPVTVTPTLSTDTSGNVVINAATGVTDTYDSTSIQFVYSITERVQGTDPTSQQLRAFVNWYMGTPLTATPTAMPGLQETMPGTTALQPGERVSGPMVVFNGTLYFATYIVPTTSSSSPASQSCNPNVPRVWGVDYVHPFDTGCGGTSGSCDRSRGGKAELVPSLGATPLIDLEPFGSTSGPANPAAGAVIPGVAISASGACAGLGTPSLDQYVGGGAQHTSPQGLGAGSYALTGGAGAPAANGAPGTSGFSINVPPPLAPTMIDSWAAVLE